MMFAYGRFRRIGRKPFHNTADGLAPRHAVANAHGGKLCARAPPGECQRRGGCATTPDGHEAQGRQNATLQRTRAKQDFARVQCRAASCDRLTGGRSKVNYAPPLRSWRRDTARRCWNSSRERHT